MGPEEADLRAGEPEVEAAELFWSPGAQPVPAVSERVRGAAAQREDAGEPVLRFLAASEGGLHRPRPDEREAALPEHDRAPAPAVQPAGHPEPEEEAREREPDLEALSVVPCAKGLTSDRPERLRLFFNIYLDYFQPDLSAFDPD